MKIKGFISLLLALIIALSSLPLSAFAETEAEIKNLALGKSYLKSVQPTRTGDYTDRLREDTNDAELTDGKDPTPDYWGDSGWVHWIGPAPEIVIDLEGIKEITSFEIVTLSHVDASSFILPSNVKIATSYNNALFNDVTTAYYPSSTEVTSPSSYSLIFTPDTAVTGRFVKFSFPAGWTLLGEIKVYGKDSGDITETPEFEIPGVANLAYGCGYEFSSSPNAAYPDENYNSITDGVSGSANIYDKAWSGWASELMPVDITIDLGSVQTFSKIDVAAMDGEGGVTYPDYISFSVSNNGTTFEEIHNGVFPDNAPSPGLYNYVYEIEGGITAQYVRVTFPANHWVFISEIQIFGEETIYPDSNNILQNAVYETSLKSKEFFEGYSDSKGKKITDGYRAKSSAWTDPANVGFKPENGKFDYTFLFDEVKTFSEIRFDAFENALPKVSAPAEIVIENKNENNVWEEVYNGTLEKYKNTKNTYIYRVPDGESLLTNGLRLKFKCDENTWIFIDEIGAFTKSSKLEANINPEKEDILPVEFIQNLPSEVFVTENETVELSVRILMGTGENVNYQWYKDGEKIGGNSSKLTIFGVTSADEGKYKVVATKEKDGDILTGESNETEIIIKDASEISEKPLFVKNLDMSAKADAGSNFTFYVQAKVNDGGELSYQWYYNNEPVGENSPRYTVENLAPSDEGFYKVVVTNTNGNLVNKAESTVCVLEVVDSNTSVNLLYGLKYEASVEVGAPYPDSGMEITDGKHGGFDWNDVSWTGSMTDISYTFDLGDVKEFEELRVSFLQIGYAAIYPARSITLYTSDNGTEWTKVTSNGILLNGATQYIYDICCTLDKVYSGRYIKVDIVKNAGWLFIDEVELWSRAKRDAMKSDNYALGAIYETNAVSVEKPDTGAKLTDGVISNSDAGKKGWVDFPKASEDNEIIIDLVDKKTIEQIEVRFLNDNAKGIRVPSVVSFEYSSDKNEWFEFGEKNILDVDESVASVYEVLQSVENAVKGRYVKITFPATEKAYIDEIVVRRNKTVIPDGKTDEVYADENNLAYKKEYTVDRNPAYGIDTGTLTNGSYGGYLYNSPEWLGYIVNEETGPMTVTLDLGDVKTFEQIKMGFLKSSSLSLKVEYPEIVDIEYSTDNVNWKSYYWEYLLWDNGGGVRRLITDNETVSGRYIRFTIEGLGYVFIDEIEVFEDADIVIDTEANPDLGIMQNLVRGLEYSSSRSADYRSTPGILTNGKYAHSASMYDENWTGYLRKKESVDNKITFLFDTLANNSVSEIILSSVEDAKNNVAVPQNINLYVSQDNVNWYDLGSIDTKNVVDGRNELKWSAEDGFNSLVPGADMVYTRYIKVEFSVPKDEGVYAFLDEVKVIGKKGKCSTSSVVASENGTYNLALNKPYKYGDLGPTPDKPDIDGVQLTDGIRGTENESDPAWVGFWRGDTTNGTADGMRYLRSITIDLQGTKSVTSVQTTFLAAENTVQPWAVHIYVSMDGVHWTYLARTTNVDMWIKGLYGYSWRGTSNIGFSRKDYIDPEIESVATNYIRVDVESLHHNLLDEIEVMGYDGIVEGALIPEGGRDLDNGRDYLMAGEETLGAQDIYLCYNGWYGYNETTQDYLGNWSASEYRPILTYIDNEGNVVDTFFDTVLLLGLVSRMGRGFLNDGITEETKFEDWQWYIEKTFCEGGDVDELNKAAHWVAEQTGNPDYTVNCIIMYPTTYLWDNDFGPIDGEYLDLYTENGWRKAARWWYNEVLKRFKEGNYDKVNFLGFYWLDEQVGFEPRMVIDSIDEAHKLGQKMYWIPMPAANGHLWAEEIGFDAIAYQPGHFFQDPFGSDSTGQIGNDQVENMIRYANYGHAGVEMELDDRYFNDVTFYNKGLDYFNAFSELGMDGPGPFRAWYDGGFSLANAAYGKEPHIRSFYDYAYQLTQGTYTHKDYIESFSDVTWEGYIGKEYSGSASPGGMGGPGGAGGGAYYEPSEEVLNAPETTEPSNDGYTWVTATNGYKLKNKEGSFVFGWAKVNGEWYYLDSDGYMKTSWVKDNDKWYYLKNSGVMVSSGWYKVHNTWYYFGGNGVMKTGWIFDGGKWYYLHAHGGMANTEWVEVNGKWYYFKGDGAMKTDWVEYLNGWYYLDNSGAMVTGWKLIENKWYYFIPDNGKMAYNTTVDGYMLSASGALI